MESITAIFNAYFCDDGTVLLVKKTEHDKKYDDNNDVRQSISTF